MNTYIGIDWSEQKHDITFLNEAGVIISQFTIPHTGDGLLKLEEHRQRLGQTQRECLVALETAHHLLVDFLWSRGYPHVYVIPPSVINGSRGRYGQSGARDDRRDSRLIADVLRTDRARLHPWRPDSLLTRQIRAKVSLINHLTRSQSRLSNRLRALLIRYHPVALTVFSTLTAQITLHFLQHYATPQAAMNLTWSEFEAFARQHNYTHPSKLPACFARLQQEQPKATTETVSVYQDEVPLLAKHLLAVVQAKAQVLRKLQKLFENHPDEAIFASLPGAGKLLAPALLVKFGDDRRRFPSPASVQALAGTCPVTDSSGKRRVIKFRQACDRGFRHIVQQWARHSLSESVWANAYWQQARPRCASDNHAYRCLGNRWLAIAWKLWQTGQEYDQDYHLRQRAKQTKTNR